jgi:hypothetical protein
LSTLAPIALFVYKRLDHVQKTLESLSKNQLANRSDLYIFSDYAKSLSDVSTINGVRNYCSKVKNFKSIKIVNRSQNFGLAKNLVSGISEVLKNNDKIIVIEDDLITDKYFLQYMNDSLNKFQNNKEVISIHGYLYPLKKNMSKPSFLKGADCWGWGTWKRGWDLYNADTNFLLNEIISNKKEKEFNFNNSYDYVGMLKRTLHKSHSSWAVKWYASAFIKNKLTLYPPHSLVHNIGNDGSGTNSSKALIYDNFLRNIPIDIDNIDIVENYDLRSEFEFYFNYKNNLIKKLYNRIFNS